MLARLSQRAEEQIKILNAFQAAGWPDRISDPLDHSETLTPKDRLRNMVRKLNETVEHTWNYVRHRWRRGMAARPVMYTC